MYIMIAFLIVSYGKKSEFVAYVIIPTYKYKSANCESRVAKNVKTCPVMNMVLFLP